MRLLLALYILLILVYSWHYREPTVQRWATLVPPPDLAPATHCQTDADCSKHHVCVHGACLPLLLRDEACNPVTGEWAPHAYRGRTFAACTCKNHYAQKYLGGDCNVDVACQPHGHFDPSTQTCSCLAGYAPDTDLTCRKLYALERPCAPDEIPHPTVADGFTATYIRKNKTCFRKPCSFDALTGRPLQHTRYDADMGCVCDPSRGQFGIRIPHLDYLQSNGPNACVSILSDDAQPIEVKVYAFFYMGGKPLSFIKFINVDEHRVAEPFRSLLKEGNLFVGQEWPYDYMQNYLKSNAPLQVHTRKCFSTTFLGIEHCLERVWVRNASAPCKQITSHVNLKLRHHSNVYDLLYQFPMCTFADNDLDVDAMYRGRHVLNPFHLTFRVLPQLMRSNGLVLHFEDGKWKLDFAESVNIERYFNVHAPVWNDPIVRALNQGKDLRPNPTFNFEII